jgi:hypothetical protein
LILLKLLSAYCCCPPSADRRLSSFYLETLEMEFIPNPHDRLFKETLSRKGELEGKKVRRLEGKKV